MGQCAVRLAAIGAVLAMWSFPSVAQAITSVPIDSVATWRLNGSAPFERAGGSATRAGDVNGDGLADALVSALEDTHFQTKSVVHVVFGRAGSGSVDLGQPGGGFRILGNHPNAILVALGSAGDLNGDGLSDVLVGARFSQDGVVAGLYVIYGKATTQDVALTNLGSAGFRVFSSTDAPSDFGWSADALGDFNGDGLADIAVGAAGDEASRRRFNQAGTAYVVYGSPAPRTIDVASPSAPVLRIFGDRSGNSCSRSLAGLGDVNGDGLRDLGLTCSEGTTPTRAATAYVVWGRKSKVPDDLSGAGPNHMKIIGRSGDGFDDIVGLGDLNGDRRSDFALGSPWSNQVPDRPFVTGGAVYVIFGSRYNTPLNFKQAPAAANAQSYRINGTPELSIGSELAAAGDVLGHDGRSDLLTTTSDTDHGFGSPGSFTLLPTKGTRGAQALTSVPGARRAVGTPDDRGFSIDRLGDFDGDGVPDMIAGSTRSNTGKPGLAYVVPLPF